MYKYFKMHDVDDTSSEDEKQIVYRLRSEGVVRELCPAPDYWEFSINVKDIDKLPKCFQSRLS